MYCLPALQAKARILCPHEHEIPIHAHLDTISALSAHADRDEMLRWCRESTGTPGRVEVVHGEPESAESFRDTLTRELGWNCSVAKYLEEIEV